MLVSFPPMRARGLFFLFDSHSPNYSFEFTGSAGMNALPIFRRNSYMFVRVQV